MPPNVRVSNSNTVLTQQLLHSSPQQQVNATVINQLPRQSLSGSLSSPPPQGVLLASTPGMPLSVGSYPSATTPNQSLSAPVSVKTEMTGTDPMQILLTEIKVEPKPESTCNSITDEDMKVDIHSSQSVDQTGIEDTSTNMSTDLDDCSANSNSSLLGSALEIKQDPGVSGQLNPVKPVAKKGNKTWFALIHRVYKVNVKLIHIAP
jgi:hypothetical protein